MQGAGLRAALWLGLSVAIGHGIVRLGYALMMPAMQADLHWGFEAASWINIANALGYIGGTATGFFLLRRFSIAGMFRTGVVMTVATLPLMAFNAGFAWFVVLRVLSGVGTAWAFSTGSTLVTQLYADDPQRRGTATGMFFGGAGLGMALSGLVVPALLEWRGAAAWPEAWIALGLLCAVLAIFPLRVKPTQGGARAAPDGSGSLQIGLSTFALLAYAGFAAAHTGYVFFVFAWTKTEHLAWYHGAGMWTLMGIGVFLSSWIWKTALGQWAASNALALCSLICAAAVALPVLAGASVLTVYLSAGAMGASMFIAPASMTVFARQNLPPLSWSKVLMLYALVFSLGQAFGSWAFGRIADTWSLTVVLGIASAGLLVSGLLAAAQTRK